MTRDQLAQALAIGRAAAERAAQRGCGLVIGGEMGIGNTSPSAALACALLGRPAAEVVGPGTGLDRAGVQRKAQVVAAALDLHATPEASPAELMERLGGFEIAALAGYFLRSGQLGMAVLLDGFIASAAALWACRTNPGLRDWLFFAHQSAEPGHRLILADLDADPLLDLGMRLGEGSGAAVALPLLRAACALHGGMATFDEAGVTG
jgi:nicotinate-nucleotide--dimethylbenzimidazole phosphoribosyltransferase